MGYVKLVKHLRINEKGPLVTIAPDGVFYLNTFTMRQYFDGVEWVEFYYDTDKGVLGIKPLRKSGANSFKLSFTSLKTKSTGVIKARSVGKALKLGIKKKKVYTAKWNKRRRILEVEI
jgi:hypothetical protein